MNVSSHHNDTIELSELADMDARNVAFDNEPAREPLLQDAERAEGRSDTHADDVTATKEDVEQPFSRVIYGVFLLLGIAMLWAWNMFLAAATYFQGRFKDNTWILNHFSPTETSTATLTILLSLFILSTRQKNASYTKRIVWALVAYIVFFTVLAFSTLITTSPQAYFGFLVFVIFGANLGTGFLQNGVFSLMVGFTRQEYTQAVMTGQAIAGVLPPVVQIISVIAVPTESSTDGATTQSGTSAFIYFITATVVSVLTLVSFLYLLHQKARYGFLQTSQTTDSGEATPSIGQSENIKSLSFLQAFKRVPYLALACIICYAVTMVFPVFTNIIPSVNGVDSAVFVPLGYLMWNVGDLLGRLIPLIPGALISHHPFVQFAMSIARLIFIPLYLLCNIKGRGATVSSDFFYLVVVQLLFGATNGYIGSSCMMTAGNWVSAHEREAIGGFMAVCISLGLTIGSLLSFLLGDI